MPADAYSAYLLPLLLAAAAVACLLLFLRRNALAAGIAVLEERLRAREAEIVDLRRQGEELGRQHEELRAAHTALREQLGREQTLLAEERRGHQEKLALMQQAREQMTLEFRHLANEILEQKGRAFTDLNRQNIHDILKPLGERIQLFEKKVEETYNRESNERFSLAREIRALQELNQRISVDAVNLTNALKGESKTQGIWGEVILERVLEKSGLMRGREYEIQVNLKTEEGRLRQPDVVVHLPENKDVIIDAKVSLKAYEQYCSELEEARREDCLKLHIQSIRAHIKALSGKDYHNLEGLRSLDFVMLFLPVEGAFTLAVQHDSNLFTEAFEKNIILVGPSTLLATLRTIQNIWRYEYQNKNALDIASRAGALYDKFVSFIDSLDDIGVRLQQTQGAYEEARKRLSTGRGNLVGNVEKLKLLGARASKQLPDKILDAEEAGESGAGAGADGEGASLLEEDARQT